MLSTLLSVISVLVALGSLWFTEKQWRKVNRKIAMLSDAGKAIEILPAWYTARMMRDHWSFGLQVSDGSLIAISNISSISDDGCWMDVELLMKSEVPTLDHPHVVFAVADDRRRASVQISKVVAAYDIITS